MSDVNNRDFVFNDFVKQQVRIAHDREAPNAAFAGYDAHFWHTRKLRDNTFDAIDNAKALVGLARSERDPAMKKEIVQRLSRMKSPEATDYMLELLK